MNFVTTNIRLTEADYLRIKLYAAKKRMSLSAAIRQSVKHLDTPIAKRRQTHLLRRLDELVQLNTKKLKHFNAAEIIRAVREER